MHRLHPLDLSPGVPDAPVLAAVERALRGAGPALLATSGGQRPPPLTPTDARLLDGAAAVVATSGSSGSPKWVVLDAPALASSAAATHDRLGGPGQWVLALPPQHVAGWQVLVRSVAAGTRPVQVDLRAGFTPEAFAAAVARTARACRRYAALVPTQLARLLQDASGHAALAALDAVLVGGAALPEPTRELLASSPARVVSTYGMTETAGGCVYDGRPLQRVRVRVDAGGRLVLGGPTLARGYLGRPELTAARFGTDPDGVRWFRTDDRGALVAGRVSVLGRVDDLVNSGGVKVDPAEVEGALLALPGVVAAHVQGVPDPQWGERVAAAVVLAGGLPRDGLLSTVRDQLRPFLPPAALPRQVVVLDRLPLLPSGKPDRPALRAVLTAENGRM